MLRISTPYARGCHPTHTRSSLYIYIVDYIGLYYTVNNEGTVYSIITLHYQYQCPFEGTFVCRSRDICSIDSSIDSCITISINGSIYSSINSSSNSSINSIGNSSSSSSINSSSNIGHLCAVGRSLV